MVQWNLSMKPPKVATGGTKLDFSGFLAPMVLPGDYTIKLKVADSVYTSKVKLTHDPLDKNFTLEDRKKQYKAATDLYKLHEQLAAVVDTINARQKLIKDNLSKVQDSSLKKTMTAYNDELEKLRSECLATKQKSIFADEKKLREEITEVYSGVTGQEAAPSNMQLQRITTLQQEVKKKDEANKDILKKYDEKVKGGLKKEGLLPLGPGEKRPF
jgi:protein subunit release factor A